MSQVFLSDLVELHSNQMPQQEYFDLSKTFSKAFEETKIKVDLKAEFPNLKILGEKRLYLSILLNFLNECQGEVRILVESVEEQDVGHQEKYG